MFAMKALRQMNGGAFRSCTKPPRACVSVRAASTSTIRGIQHDLRSKNRSAVEITQQYLDGIARTEPQIKSYISVNADLALQQARAVDEQIAKDGVESLGPLSGVPLAVKDNICTRGVVTTAGSKVLANYVPPYNATAVAKLLQAGAVCLGKTNCDEFGMGSTTENSAYQQTSNPWDTARVPGGSSGGSATAVAAAQCAASLGSDTGGSIRQPAHFCGVVGLKPTYGRVSRYGLVAYASSLDCIGPMATSVEDAALLLNAIAGQDRHDATSSGAPVEDFTAGLRPLEALGSQPLQGVRVGVVAQTVGEGVDARVGASVQAALEHLRGLGASVDEVSLPAYDHALPAYYVLACSEASSNLSRYDGVRYGARQPAEELRGMYFGTRGQGLGAEVKRRILMGTYALSAGYIDAFYKQAQQVRGAVQQEMAAALQTYDLLVTPPAPTPAYKLGEKTADPLEMYKGDLMTVTVNLAGLPAVVLPCAVVEEGGVQLPVGVQMIGRAFGEAELLRVAHVFEQTLQLPAARPLVHV